MTITTLLSEFDREMANTRKILESVPGDRFDWTPHEKSTTLGKLANHLAAMPSLAAAVMNGQAKRMPETGLKAELLEALDRNLATGRAAITEAGDDCSTWSAASGSDTSGSQYDSRGRSAQQGDEPHDPPSRPTDCLPAATRCGGTRHVRAVRDET